MAKAKKKVGRPCKLTPEVHGKIVANVGRGAFPWVAARAAGISPSTFYLWMKLGDEGDKDFSEFSEDVHKAAADARLEAESAVRRLRPVDWLRLGPGRDRGGNEPGWTERTELSGPGGGPIQVEGTVIVATSDDEKKYVEALRNARGEKP